MNEVVDQIAAKAGIDPELAEKAIGMILGFLQREAADGPIARMIEAIPGASDLVAQYNGEGAGGGASSISAWCVSAHIHTPQKALPSVRPRFVRP